MFREWTLAKAAELYRIPQWGEGYFGLSEDGEVTVGTDFPSGRVEVSVVEIVQRMRQCGLRAPALVRIENILDDRIRRLNEGFNAAIAQLNYCGRYRGVFPIKVNQQRQVIEEVVAFGARYSHGLEAGSKAELLIALAALSGRDGGLNGGPQVPPDSGLDGLIICNGYKDRAFFTLALLAQKLGYPCFLVVETPSELPILLACAAELGVRPRLGVRLKLATRVGGLWNESSGDRSLFGLNTHQLMDLVEELRARDLLDCLELVHCHLGSQIPNIRDIRRGVIEACRYYVDLIGEGAPLGYLDLGGGLAVDYEGGHANRPHSRNYRLEEYCTDLVAAVMTVLDPAGVTHPILITESGRATVAYASLLVVNILDQTRFEPAPLPDRLAADEHPQLHNLWRVEEALTPSNLQAGYNDAHHYLEEIRDLFHHGQVRLRSMALAESLFLRIIWRIVRELEAGVPAPPELAGLREQIADIYYANFSVFQSLPDAWAIGQLFPVLPLARHHEPPLRQAVIADLTCDSDGRIDRFLDPAGTRRALPVHPRRPGEDYYLGIFLVGAYQETLGDLHNLMGDGHIVSVRLKSEGGFDLVKELPGDSIAKVLGYVGYDPAELRRGLHGRAEVARQAGLISAADAQQVMAVFEASLNGYTYLEL